MPKVVDPEARRRELAESVWRVIRRDGLEHASVRNVAREAGLSMGSLRHYFATQSELLAFAMRLVHERVQRRIAALDLSGDPRQVVERALQEALPLDAERHAEMEVWLAFTARALVDPKLRALRDEGHSKLRELCRRCVEALARRPGLDVAAEAERLHALIDGLALHRVLDPATTTPQRVVELLAAHLDELAGQA
ncbi:TetR family transcriptional regulator [Carbonactinospora thermoautotrophica]|uniref:Regulatory protein TetR n=1 Tax=Carbonactinospora thermoautotrophica TaxID=1469144 RepID=A0A132NI39_9ACTN|nr:TetR family transcriptional regulator C-terminal domain-containing protein [Carbonactinospora thermoautotrophica]KWX00428.1 TetR family transcriptional regulator [Carbonactinospora thermoautotrophica]KWX01488.1 Regulatory protein TetR [Carbonactinospora thermoautotrophica]KWX09402.1 TetR family transcriptional regulator [Carbonactinospora thermoautotrophica]